MIKKQCFNKTVSYLLTAPRGVGIVFLVVSLSALVFALLAEHFWGVKPCVLCMYQRYVMLVLIGAAIVGFLTQMLVLRWIYALVVLVGLAMAGYHVGVEQHWWKGPDACSSEAPLVDSHASQADQIKAFKAKMKQKSAVVVRCDDVNWRIFGVSATIWTFLLYMGFLGFLAASFVYTRHTSID